MNRIEQMPVADQIALGMMALAETGSWTRDYAKVTFEPDDPGGLSVGWGQAAYQTRAATLKKFFEEYVQKPDAMFGDTLSPWLPKLAGYWGTKQEQLLSRRTQADPQLHSLLVQMAGDPVWRSIQDSGFLAYHERAMQRANNRGYSSDLMRCLLVDMEIQHGGDWLLARALKAMAGEGHKAYQRVLQTGAKDNYGGDWPGQDDWDVDDELDVIKATLLLRIDFLMTEGPTPKEQRIWPPTTYRCNHIMWLAEREQLSFDWGMTVRTIHPRWMRNKLWTIQQGLLSR